MTAPPGLRKGWCPGALRPMPAKDGLLVRLRPTAGRLSATALRAIARAGREHGNGRFDLTSRAHLQMRGIRAERLPHLHETLRAHGLLDATAAGEALRNLLVSPLAGLEGPDVGAVAAALEAALVADASLQGLPGKFAVSIDDGSALSLGAVPADIRFVRVAPGSFAIGLGGTDADAALVATCTMPGIVPAALGLARAFLQCSASAAGDVHRMRDLLRLTPPQTIAAAAGLAPSPDLAPIVPAVTPLCPIGLLRLGSGTSCLGLGAAFGRLDASMLEQAAETAESFGTGEIRLTPWRSVLVTGVARMPEPGSIANLARHGFITDPRDARRAVAACVGAAGCESATTDTRSDAAALAVLARKIAPEGVTLHVSGCAKGCARPKTTAVVLVAREGCYDMVRDGTAAATPQLRGLSLADAAGLLETMGQERLGSS